MLRDTTLIVKRLQREGWILISVRGSHHKYRKDGLMIIVPADKKKGLPSGTARNIAKIAGWE